MNFEETGKILAVIKKNYPHAYKDFTREEKEDLIVLWQEMFADDDYGVVGAAVKSYIATDTKGFAPVIGQIKELIRKITEPNEMSEQEAWGYVAKALRNSGYNSAEEFEKLPAQIQRVVGSPSQLRDWALMDSDTVQSVVASNFQRSYRARAKSDKEYQALPSSVREMLESVSNKFLLE